MKINLSDLYRVNPRKACQLAMRRTVNLEASVRMDAINKLLGSHGVEAIRGDWQNGYWCDIVATYCNTGETYALTVLEQRGATRYDHSRVFIGTVGDFVERNGKKLGIL